MNKYIQKLINEQFNIGNMDLNRNMQKRNTNIFNKAFIHPYYQNILDDTATKDEIKELNSLVGVVVPKNKDELKKIIEFYSLKYPKDSLNWLDVSRITDMSNLFEETKYNGNISKWDVSHVTDMSYMFLGLYYDLTPFNKDISKWDVSSVTNMQGMFMNSSFNKDISKWDVSSVTNMQDMFYHSEFNKDISKWDVSNVENMTNIFMGSKFKQDLSRWDISKLKYYILGKHEIMQFRK